MDGQHGDPPLRRSNAAAPGELKLWWPLRSGAVNGGEAGEGLHGRECAGRCLSGSANLPGLGGAPGPSKTRE